MAVYWITQFQKSPKHGKGAVNREVQQVDGTYHTIKEALTMAASVMARNRFKGFLRLDQDVKFNAIAYIDLDEGGGVIRFRKRDGYHFYPQIPLSELKRRLSKR